MNAIGCFDLALGELYSPSLKIINKIGYVRFRIASIDNIFSSDMDLYFTKV